MCGIIGIMGRGEVSDRLVQGLKLLEYRGYDSAGLCTIHGGGLDRRRARGKISVLEGLLKDHPLPGRNGIAHTRWATHGQPSERNAHPHATPHVALVHNGIIENWKQLKDELLARGRIFESETDSEVVVQLLSEQVEAGMSPQEAIAAVMPMLKGAFSLAILFRDHPDLLIGVRMGSPLVLGFGESEFFLGSDAMGLAPFAKRLSYLENGDWVAISQDEAAIYDRQGRKVTRKISECDAAAAHVDKGPYRHFMHKEILEQPQAVAATIEAYADYWNEHVPAPWDRIDLAGLERITIVACGSSFYAGMIAKYWFEDLAGIAVEVDLASEFRHRRASGGRRSLALFISQSGETADTLEALRHARARDQAIAAVVNVPTSSIARETDVLLPTHAGPEIGVASTKAFACQLAVLAIFAIQLGRARGTLSPDEQRHWLSELASAPGAMIEAIGRSAEIEAVAHRISSSRDALYLGRGTQYPLALEGALKLKEISYIHAEGYAAGEMKHGPIALVDGEMPVIVLAPSDALFDKTESNMKAVQARGGQAILISDSEGIARAGADCIATIQMPRTGAIATPLTYAIPLQLIAYYAALRKGTDVDQPRNLAKSVTVE